MNWIPQVSSGAFAVAGLACAAGPILIHLLNRRRFRRVEWAAMEFLHEAFQHQKRKLKLRDLVLLLLRTLAVLLFGIALARPFFASNGAALDAHSPRHLVLLMDNSLSMGYRHVDTTLLDDAKRQARLLIESLPDGSQVTIAATCGSANYHAGPVRRKSDALELLSTVQVADSVSRMEDVLATARATIGAATPLADQVIYFTDLQRSNWPSDSGTGTLEQLPNFQIRDMARADWDNAWVAEVRLGDDVVDLDNTTTVFTTLQRQGPATRRIDVALSVSGQVVATRSIELPPGLSQRQLVFECSFSDAPVEPGSATFVPLEISLTPDRLQQDDQRTVMVPVVASLPVVFVDQYATEDEDPALGHLGETRPLRHLLAPRAADRQHRPLVDIQHVTIEQVTPALLASARLVVVAGVETPGPAIDILFQYVQQGGPLVLAASESFDIRAWNQAAGPAGVGLLPGLMADQPVGVAPNESSGTPLEPFNLAFESLTSDRLLRLPGLSDDELRELYQEPLFFKTIALDVSSTDQQILPRGAQPPSILPSAPRWLAWSPPSRTHARTGDQKTGSSPSASPTHVCARFANAQAVPYLVRHPVGKGEVIFASSSISPTWNNLAQTNAIVFWDHMLRTMIRSTLPQRNFTPQGQLSIPVPLQERGGAVLLQRPSTSVATETLDIGFIERNRRGVTITDAWTRGAYQLASTTAADETGRTATRFWQMGIAVNGEASESDLTSLSNDETQTRIIDSGMGTISDGDSLGAIHGGAHGNAIWWWLVVAVLGLLAAELLILTLSQQRLSWRRDP